MSSEEKANSLITSLMQGKEIHDKFAANMRAKFLINERTMDEWEEQYRIEIETDNLTPAICRQYDVKLLQYNQEVAFFHAMAAAKVQLLSRGHVSAYRDKFYALVQEYKDKGAKLPAAATLDNLAKVETDDVESASTIAEVEKSFWSNILDHLTTCRKIIENATMNNNVDARLARQGG
jgi:hypothetical protein